MRKAFNIFASFRLFWTFSQYNSSWRGTPRPYTVRLRYWVFLPFCWCRRRLFVAFCCFLSNEVFFYFYIPLAGVTSSEGGMGCFRIKPQSVIRPKYHFFLPFFYWSHFSISFGILSTSLSWRSPLRLRQWCAQSARNKYRTDINPNDRFGLKMLILGAGGLQIRPS